MHGIHGIHGTDTKCTVPGTEPAEASGPEVPSTIFSGSLHI